MNGHVYSRGIPYNHGTFASFSTKVHFRSYVALFQECIFRVIRDRFRVLNEPTFTFSTTIRSSITRTISYNSIRKLLQSCNRYQKRSRVFKAPCLEQIRTRVNAFKMFITVVTSCCDRNIIFFSDVRFISIPRFFVLPVSRTWQRVQETSTRVLSRNYPVIQTNGKTSKLRSIICREDNILTKHLVHFHLIVYVYRWSISTIIISMKYSICNFVSPFSLILRKFSFLLA